jgi:hypothetical protein
MSTRTLTLLASALLAAPLASAADGERPERPEPGALFGKFDQDGSGGLSLKEFVHGLHQAQHERRKKDEGRPRPQGGEGEGSKPPAGEEGEGRPRPPRRDGDGPRPPAGEGDGEARPRPVKPDGEGPRPAGDGEGRPHPEQREKAAKAAEAFAAGDADRDGNLTREEFRAAMEALPRPPRPPTR